MKILGIDPGMAIVGYGLIEIEEDKIELLTSGSIQTDKNLPDSKRLLEILITSNTSPQTRPQYTNREVVICSLC